jgi:hypothetical protein
MIDNDYIKHKILPIMSHKGRKLEYYLIKNMIGNYEKDLLNELLQFQNEDGGFGNGLEVDMRMPNSSAASTNIACTILASIYDKKIKEDTVKSIVQYFEKTFNEKINGWDIVPKAVDDFPHAIWWNYDQRHTFTYGNPNPEIIGFLYQNRLYLKHLDINHLVNLVVNYIRDKWESESTMHSLLSVLRFYNYMDRDIQNLIINQIHKVIDKEIETDESKWLEYGLEPYKIAVFGSKFLLKHYDIFNKNLVSLQSRLEKGYIKPNHQWFQYKDEESIYIDEWIGLFTYDALKALRYKRYE